MDVQVFMIAFQRTAFVKKSVWKQSVWRKKPLMPFQYLNAFKLMN
ncbi:hypothetical protein PLA106_27621 [Pseudomonas amygdali pv. lachrymans str. M302278]|nr:hypothetical protein PLA106_27621 [Pseudomonas amygdali pv. lachrymans str. M302278]